MYLRCFFLDIIRLFDRYYTLGLGCRFLFILNPIDARVVLCNRLYRVTQAHQEWSLGVTHPETGSFLCHSQL